MPRARSSRELRAALDEIGRPAEIIAVDDGSSDGSFERLVGAARDGAAAARRPAAAELRADGGDGGRASSWRAATSSSSLDADLQNDPRDIPRLLAALGDDVDVVQRLASRAPGSVAHAPPAVADREPHHLGGHRDQPARLRLHAAGHARRRWRRSCALYGELHRFIPALAADLGARVVEMPVTHRPRTLGRSKYGLSRTLRVLLDLLTVKFLSGFATRPIQLFGAGRARASRVPGLVLTGRARASSGSSSGVRLAGRPIVLLAILLAVLGVQFVSIGLLGEMMVRTYHESQGKPIFRIRARGRREVRLN